MDRSPHSNLYKDRGNRSKLGMRENKKEKCIKSLKSKRDNIINRFRTGLDLNKDIDTIIREEMQDCLNSLSVLEYNNIISALKMELEQAKQEIHLEPPKEELYCPLCIHGVIVESFNSCRCTNCKITITNCRKATLQKSLQACMQAHDARNCIDSPSIEIHCPQPEFSIVAVCNFCDFHYVVFNYQPSVAFNGLQKW